MGAFFTSVQVRGGERGPLVEALTADAREAGMDPHEGDGADRTVLILPPDEGGWIAIYDEATDSQDLDRLEALGALASRALGRPAFSVLVHDSDVLDLRLFRDGARVDRFDSFPGYFEGKASKKQKAEAAGHPERWREVLVSGSVEDLRAAWTAEDLFAERALAETCELVGCDAQRAFLGYRNALGSPLPEGTITLRFRSRERPAYEAPVEGPPVFAQHAIGPAVQPAAVGDALRVSCSTRNEGGAAIGLSVLVWGSAIDQELVEVGRFELLVGNVQAGAKHQSLMPERTRSTDGERMLVARCEDQPIPAGTNATFGPGVDPLAMRNAMMGSTVHVNVVGRVVRAGRGTIEIALVPHANEEDGATATSTTLAIDPPFARPLRALPSDPLFGQSSHLLRPLAGDRYLVLLIAFDASREASVPYARRAIEASLSILGARWSVSRTTFRRDPQKRRATGKGKAETLLRGKRLEGLLGMMVDELSVGLELREEGPRAAGWGVALGTGVLPMMEEERAPALGLWADASALDAEKVSALREAWSSIASHAIASGEAAQAVLLRGGWTPAVASLSRTAYELVCGINDQVTTLRAWVRRYVRVPGNDRLWLGRELAERVTDEARAKLEGIASIEKIGDGIRIELADRAGAGALEEALAEWLPSREDAAPVAGELYKRRAT